MCHEAIILLFSVTYKFYMYTPTKGQKTEYRSKIDFRYLTLEKKNTLVSCNVIAYI